MLYHHDSRDYQEAASDAAKRARDKLWGLIDRGRGRAMNVIEKVNQEVPKDYIVGANALDFKATDKGVGVIIPEAGEFGVHQHALGQMAQRVNFSTKTTREWEAGPEWQRDLLAHNLKELYQHAGTRHLVRTVDERGRDVVEQAPNLEVTALAPVMDNPFPHPILEVPSLRGEVRGFLSDSFRRLDSRPIIEAFAAGCSTLGAVPVEGYYMQTKIAIKGLLPMVFEPVDNEVMAFGLVLQNSDYGHGALSIRSFVLRLWCTNYAITDECLRQVHLGKRLDDNIRYSERTYELDTQAQVSAVDDIMQQVLGPEMVNGYMAAIKAAHEEKISPREIKDFLKKFLLKGEGEAVADAFNSPDVENLPAGQSKWRLSNAISWVAGNTEDEVRRLELQQVAGQLVQAA